MHYALAFAEIRDTKRRYEMAPSHINSDGNCFSQFNRFNICTYLAVKIRKIVFV
jgi:hypothetical protein